MTEDRMSAREALVQRVERLKCEGRRTICEGEGMCRTAERLEMLVEVLDDHRVFEDENLERALWALISETRR